MQVYICIYICIYIYIYIYIYKMQGACKVHAKCKVNVHHAYP